MDQPVLRPANVLSESDRALLRRLLHERTGVVLDPSRDYFAEMRLGALATEEGFGSLTDVVEALRTEESWGLLHRLVVEVLAISETSWFRDAHVWNEIRDTLLPALVGRRVRERRLRVWSAACATGQEPYSMAILFQELGTTLAGWDVQILATDFSRGILKRARAASYSQIEMNRGLPAAKLVRHFRKARDAWELKPEVRDRVEFRELNLATDWPPMPPMDLVLLRNVLLYFEPELRRQVLRRVAENMDPDGFLVLGSGETTLTMDDSFEPIPLEQTVVFRRARRT